MLAVLGVIFGFLGPLLPELLKWLNKKADQAHELAMLQLQIQAAEQIHRAHMEEIEATADIKEAEMLHVPQQSFGVQMLDAAAKLSAAGGLPKFVTGMAFVAYVGLDWLVGAVRPAVTFAVVVFYMTVKLARYQLMTSVVSSDTRWFQNVAGLWDENDLAVLLTVVSYYFGGRTAKWAFGQKGAR